MCVVHTYGLVVCRTAGEWGQALSLLSSGTAKDKLPHSDALWGMSSQLATKMLAAQASALAALPTAAKSVGVPQAWQNVFVVGVADPPAANGSHTEEVPQEVMELIGSSKKGKKKKKTKRSLSEEQARRLQDAAWRQWLQCFRKTEAVLRDAIDAVPPHR